MTLEGIGRRVLRPTELFVADQILSSLTNVIVVFAAARGESRYEFGAFSLVYGLCILGLGLRSGSLGDLVLVDSDRPGTAQLAAGSSIYLGALTGVVAALVAVGVGLDPIFTMCALLGMPFVLLQDSMRSHAFARRRPGDGLVLDGLWLLVQVVVIVLFGGGATNALLGWVAGGTAGAVLGLRMLRPDLRPSDVAEFLGSRRRLLGSYVLQYMVSTGTSQVLAFLIAGLGQVSEVGALRGAITIAGPYNVMMNADRVDLITRLRSGGTRHELSRRLAASAVLLTVAAAALVGACVAVPISVGDKFLGLSWKSAVMILPAVACHFWLNGLAQGYQSRLTAALRPSESLQAKGLAALVSLSGFGALVAFADISPLVAAVVGLIAGSILNLSFTAAAARRVAPTAGFATASSGGLIRRDDDD